jgi:lysophospholipase L1-like esterase
LKRIFSRLFLLCKWVIAGIILVEITSFLIICLSNYWIYGQIRDGEKVSYDPYALFLEGVRPTLNNPAAPGPGAWTFWLFGGSTMRGATDFDDRTIPSLLALNWNREEPDRPATMVNFGQDGFNSLMETKYLQKLLIENRAPSLIVFYDGGNDSAYFAQDRNPYAHHGYERVRGMIEDYHRSLFGLLKPLNAAMWSSFTHELYDKIRQGVLHIDPEGSELRQFADSCAQRYDYLDKLAAGFGAKFLLVYQPCWWAETKPVAARVRAQEDVVLGKKLAIRDNFMVCYQALVGRLQEKPYFINFRNILCDRGEPLYQSDGIHLLDPGRKIVASRLEEVLKERLLAGEAPGKPLAGMPQDFLRTEAQKKF